MLTKRFVGAVDKAVLIDKKSANDAAIAAVQEFNDILKKTKDTFLLKDDVINKIINDYNTEKRNTDFIETSEIYAFPQDKKDTSYKKTRSDKIEDYLLTTIPKKVDRFIYNFYFRVYFSIQHFVGPGAKKADSALKNKNLGELCTQFGNSENYSEL